MKISKSWSKEKETEWKILSLFSENLVHGILSQIGLKRSCQDVSKRHPSGSEEVYDTVPKDEAGRNPEPESLRYV